MLLIATNNLEAAEKWKRALQGTFEIYETIIESRRSLDICLKRVKVDTLILQVELIGSEGINDLSTLLEVQKNTNIILFADNFDERDEISSILFGAKAYLNLEFDPLLP